MKRDLLIVISTTYSVPFFVRHFDIFDDFWLIIFGLSKPEIVAECEMEKTNIKSSQTKCFSSCNLKKNWIFYQPKIMPRILCNGNWVLPHLQMGYAVKGFVRTSGTTCIIHKNTSLTHSKSFR